MNAASPERCRLVLVAPATADAAALARRLDAAFAGGDVASLILPRHGLEEAAFQRLAETLTPLAQARGVAVVLEGDSRIAARVGADGIHLEGGPGEVADAVDRLAGRMMVGAGGARSRDDALLLGERGPDYLFFGRFGYDNRPEPHPRNLALGEWWAQMIEIPCIVLGGSGIASVAAAAATGAEFVALSAAVFSEGTDPRAAVEAANRVLDGGPAPEEAA